MKLTSQDIRRQTFEKILWGCDPAEVQAFLNVVAIEWEHVSKRLKELESGASRSSHAVAHEAVESAASRAISLTEAIADADPGLSGDLRDLLLHRNRMLTALEDHLATMAESLSSLKRDHEALWSRLDRYDALREAARLEAEQREMAQREVAQRDASPQWVTPQAATAHDAASSSPKRIEPSPSASTAHTAEPARNALIDEILSELD